MIKKRQLKPNHNPIPSTKTNTLKQYQPLQMKKLYNQKENYQPIIQSEYLPSSSILKSNKYSPLKDIYTQNIDKQLQTHQKFEKYLKSQNSLNDLSAIAPVQMSCSNKKDNNQQFQFMQNFDKICRQGATNYRQNLSGYFQTKINNKKNSIQSVIKNNPSISRQLPFQQENQQSIIKIVNKTKHQTDDFEILDIYATSLLNINQSIVDQSKQQRRKIRKCGGIKRNSKPFITEKQMFQNQNQNYNLTDDSIVLNLPEKQKNVDNFKKISKIQNCKKQNPDNKLNQTIQYLFYSISANKNTVNQLQIQRFPFTCQMRLLLGPILLKFRQKKFTNLNQHQFQKEFQSVLKGFSQKQKTQIFDKILQGKYFTGQILDKLPQFRNLMKKELKNEDFSQRMLRIKNQQITNETQDRLTLLGSKVDNFLSRINEKSSNNQEISKKQKLSTLMSRLSEIEEISGDSDDLMSRNESHRDQKNYICPNKNVYVNETFLINERGNDTIYGQREIQSRLFIEKPYSQSLSQSRTNFEESKRSSMVNSRLNIQSQNRRVRNLNPNSIRANSQEEILYTSSLRPINLSFSQLQKYLQ